VNIENPSIAEKLSDALYVLSLLYEKLIPTTGSEIVIEIRNQNHSRTIPRVWPADYQLHT
jgi:hypothetical protein